MKERDVYSINPTWDETPKATLSPQQIVDDAYARIAATEPNREEVMKACDDAQRFGAGFVEVSVDGIRHIEPAPGTKLAEWQAAGNRISDENVPLTHQARALRSAMEGLARHCETIVRLRADPFATRTPGDGMIYQWDADAGRWEHPTAMPGEAPKPNYHGPDDQAHRAVHDVTEHLLGGRVTNAKARAGLRDALDKADRPAEGRKKSDQSLGRAIRLEGPGHRYDPIKNRTYGVPVDANALRVPPPPAPKSSPKPPLPATELNPGKVKTGLFVP